MAHAIENSICILMCVTEKYKESNFCRLEAEYLVQKNKPFIPMLMEKGYRPDGWLGIILGSKIFVDFTKLDFTLAMKELNRNLDLILNNTTQQNASKPPPLTKPTTNQQDASQPNISDQQLSGVIGSLTQNTSVNKEKDEVKWSESQVEAWLTEKNINQLIIENLAPCNGQGNTI